MSKSNTPLGANPVPPPSPAGSLPGATVRCDDCEKEVAAAVCVACALRRADEAFEAGCEPDDDEDGPLGPSDAIRDWAQRQRLLGNLDLKTAELFEECAQDLED